MSWGVANFLFPFWSQTSNVRFASRAITRAWVPMDDEHVMLFNITGFLHDIETRMRMRAIAFTAHKIGYGANDDAVFTTCDLGGECSTEYMRNYALLSRYLAGAQNTNARAVAAALRILVKEFYKVRYPTEFTSTMTLGGFIEAIRAALAGSPLANFAANVDALERFNVFARRFHHSNPNAQNEPLNEHELRRFARGAMSLIHDDGMSSPIP
jgi:hypothetical protein